MDFLADIPNPSPEMNLELLAGELDLINDLR